MSNLWWFDPEWKQATCAKCGTNIWNSGGDPDWGYCFDCFTENLNNRNQEKEMNDAID